MNRSSKSRRIRFAVAGAVALAVGLLASLGAVSYAAKFVGVTGASPVAAQYPPSKVTICHHTHSQKNPAVTITISERALPAHLAHGDTIGPCSAPPIGAPAVKAAVKAGKKNKPQHSSHKGKKSHPSGLERSALRKALKANRDHGQGKSGTQGQASGQGSVQGQSGTKVHGQGTGHANGHAKQHGLGNGNGQGAGHGNGNGGTYGPANGNGQGTGQGTPGGGKGHQK
jgi:hypothetical protein